MLVFKRLRRVSQAETVSLTLHPTSLLVFIAISVIRMIKLFGWEDRVNKQIDEKRNEELKYMKRRTLWNTGNYCVKFVWPTFLAYLTHH